MVKSTALVPVIPTAQLDEIVELARQQVQTEDLISDLESALADHKETLRRISEEDLPAAMAEANMQKFTLSSGQTIEISHDFAVGIPKEETDRAYDWLERRGFGGMIGTSIIVTFGKGEVEKAATLMRVLQAKKLEVAMKRAVHYQTLKAWIKEMDRDKKKFPAPLFGAHPLVKAVIKLPKAAK